MKTTKWLLCVGALSMLTTALVGCGGSSGDDDDDVMMTDHAMADAKMANKYVMSNINIPDKSSENDQLGFDLDNDSRHSIDNKLGSIIQLIAANAGSSSVDLQGQVDMQVTMGKIILLGSYKSTAFVTESNTVFQMYLGKDADTDATNNLGGNGMFTIDTAGPQDAKFYGGSAAGVFKSTEPASATIKLALVEGDPVSIKIIAAKIQASPTATGVTNAKLGGGITKTELEMNVLPAVFGLITKQIMDDPNGSGSMAIKQLFDTDKNGTITEAEFKASNTIQTVLSPDVDLLKADGTVGKDGVKESVSLGVGFTAVKGIF